MEIEADCFEQDLNRLEPDPEIFLSQPNAFQAAEFTAAPGAGAFFPQLSFLSMSRRDLDALLAYLTENAGRFSLDALRAQMVKAGHKPVAVERALRVFQGTEPPPDPPSWPGVVTVAVGDLVLVGLFAWLFTHAHKQSGCAIIGLLPVLCLLEFIVGLTLLASGGRQRLGRALFFGVLLFFGVSLAIVSVWGATKMGGLSGS